MNLRDQVLQKLKEGHAYTLRYCSMCKYPLKYTSDGNRLLFDPGCHCVRTLAPKRLAEWGELDNYFTDPGHVANFQKWLGISDPLTGKH